MSSVLQLLKLADFPAPQQQPTPAAIPPPAPTPEPAAPPPAVVGSAFKAPTITPAAGSNGFTVQHQGLGDGAIDTASVEQQQQMAEQQQEIAAQQMGDMKTKVDMTTQQQKQTQDLLKKNTDQWLSSMSSRLADGGGSKVASDPGFLGPLNPDSPTGTGPTPTKEDLKMPAISTPGWVSQGSGWKGVYDSARKFALGGLWNRYAPKPLGAISDVNSRFGRPYMEAADTVGRLTQKQPPGIALLANLAGGIATKYFGGGTDLSQAGTDVSNLVDKAGPIINSFR